MSRVALPAEKVLAIKSTFNALIEEVGGRMDTADPRVQVALLDAATRVAMGTDTRDMGIMGSRPTTQDLDRGIPCDDCGWEEGHDPSVEH